MKGQTMEQELINAIGSVGFPIVACVYMAYIHNDAEKRHSEERVNMTEALTKMNVMLQSIIDMLKDKD